VINLPKKPSKKEEDAKTFESKLNSETKNSIEKILDSVDETSVLSGARALDGLFSLLGEQSARFLVKLLDSQDTEWIQEIKGVSTETKDYLYFLFGKYVYRLRGILSNRKLKFADSWATMRHVSTNYDLESQDLFVKLAIFKNNNECILIEDAAGALLELSCNIIDCVAKEFVKTKGFQLDLNDLTKEINKSKERLEAIQKRLPNKGPQVKKKKTK
jgi:hypothetical protein